MRFAVGATAVTGKGRHPYIAPSGGGGGGGGGGLDPVTLALNATGSGTRYNIHNLTDFDAVPFGALAAGDVVNIYNDDLTGSAPTTYARKIGLRAVGTLSNPIIINGVTDSLGNRPVLDGSDAITAPGSNPSGGYNGATDVMHNPSAGYGVLGLILSTHGPVDNFNTFTPQYFTIQNLKLIHTDRGNSFYDVIPQPTITFTGALSSGATSGTLSSAFAQSNSSTSPNTNMCKVRFSNGDVRLCTLTNGSTSVTWTGGGLTSGATATGTLTTGAYTAWPNEGFNAAFWIDRGKHFTITNCWMDNCPLGVFTQVNGDLDIATCSDFTLSYNRVTNGGTLGSLNGSTHSWYVQGYNVTTIGNMMRQNKVGSMGSTYKSRTANEIFAFNYVESTARALDFVQSESGNPGVASQSTYGVTYCFGNTILNDLSLPAGGTTSNPIHYGCDNTGEDDPVGLPNTASPLDTFRTSGFWEAGLGKVSNLVSSGSNTLVTLSNVQAGHPYGNYAVANSAKIYFFDVAGMTGINGQTGTLTAVGGSSGAWTATVALNSSGFGTYSSGGYAGGNKYVQPRSQLYFWNNTFVNRMGATFSKLHIFDLSLSAIKADVWDNIFVFDGSGCNASWLPFAGRLNIWGNNLIQYLNGAPTVMLVDYNYDSGGTGTNNGLGASGGAWFTVNVNTAPTTGNPLFRNYATNDFHLSAGSPALNAAVGRPGSLTFPPTCGYYTVTPSYFSLGGAATNGGPKSQTTWTDPTLANFPLNAQFALNNQTITRTTQGGTNDLGSFEYNLG